MTAKEALEIFESFIKTAPVNPYTQPAMLAIEALKKQIPKEPIPQDRQHIRYSMNYICPSCGKGFSGTGIAAYCYHCGQALDWGEEE